MASTPYLYSMTLPHPVVFLVDVDNTLLDNGRIQQHLKDHLKRNFGRAAREGYWQILEELSDGGRSAAQGAR